LRRSIDRQELPQKERAGPARPVHTVGIIAGSIRGGSDLRGGIGIHDQQAPQNRLRDLPLLRPIYLAGLRPATDPRGWLRGSLLRRHPRLFELAAILPQSWGRQVGAVHSYRSRHCATGFHDLSPADFGVRNHFFVSNKVDAGGRSIEATLAGPGLSAGQETLQVPGHGPRRGITPLRVLCQCSHQDTFQPLR